MITEIATLTIDPAKAAAFEAAIAQASPLFRAAEGCTGMMLERTIEDPARYRLIVQWQSVAHHMDLFRNSPAFQEWRVLAGPFFAAPPEVVHGEAVVSYF